MRKNNSNTTNSSSSATGLDHAVFRSMMESELLADEILAERNQTLVLAKQKSENREALNAVRAVPEAKQLWVSTGTIFLLKPKADVVSLIEKDNAIMEQETKELTVSIKNKTYRLKEMEGRAEEVNGFFLEPLSKKDTQFFNQS